MIDKIRCILDSNRGVYIPKNFVDEFDLNLFKGIEKEDAESCKLGPDDGEYWEAWTSILDNAVYTDDDDIEWTLYQDGDLFLIAVDELSDEEYADFFGEPRN